MIHTCSVWPIKHTWPSLSTPSNSGPIWKSFPPCQETLCTTFFFFLSFFSLPACFILHSEASLPTNLFTTKPNPSSLDSSAVLSLDKFHLHRHSISFRIKLCSMLKSRDCSLTQQYQRFGVYLHVHAKKHNLKSTMYLDN